MACWNLRSSCMKEKLCSWSGWHDFINAKLWCINHFIYGRILQVSLSKYLWAFKLSKQSYFRTFTFCWASRFCSWFCRILNIKCIKFNMISDFFIYNDNIVKLTPINYVRYPVSAVICQRIKVDVIHSNCRKAYVKVIVYSCSIYSD